MKKFFVNCKNPQGDISCKIAEYNSVAELNAVFEAVTKAAMRDRRFDIVESADLKLVVEQKATHERFEYYVTEEERKE